MKDNKEVKEFEQYFSTVLSEIKENYKNQVLKNQEILDINSSPYSHFMINVFLFYLLEDADDFNRRKVDENYYCLVTQRDYAGWNKFLNSEQIEVLFRFLKDDERYLDDFNIDISKLKTDDIEVLELLVMHKNSSLYIIIEILKFLSILFKHNGYSALNWVLQKSSADISKKISKDLNISFSDLEFLYNVDKREYSNIREAVINHPNFNMERMIDDFINS